MRASAPRIFSLPAAKANFLTHLYGCGKFYLNIKDAIQAYLETIDELSKGQEFHYVEAGNHV